VLGPGHRRPAVSFTDDVKSALADTDVRLPPFLQLLSGYLVGVRSDPAKLDALATELVDRGDELAQFLTAGRTTKLRRTRLAGRRKR
jgi:hypothetical protein